jgi:hypothetical protein
MGHEPRDEGGFYNLEKPRNRLAPKSLPKDKRLDVTSILATETQAGLVTSRTVR